MTILTLDEFGRIAIPENIREQLGLVHNTQFNVQVQQGQLVLQPLPQEVKLYKEGEVLVFEATPTGDIEILIDRLRQERIDELMSW